MKKLILLMMLIVSALTAKAQYNVVIYPSEKFEYEHYEDHSFGFAPPVLERWISTGDAQRLTMSFFNKETSPITLNVVIKDGLDGTVLLHDIINIETNHLSERLECVAPKSYTGYFWHTEITVVQPAYYDFEAYWIYQYLNVNK